MTDEKRWQADLEEMEFFLLVFFIEAWTEFWWCEPR